MERAERSSTTIAKLSPSEVRERILDEHRALRRDLVALQELAREVTLDESRTPELRERARALLEAFSAHLESEEALLLPAIEAADAWGAERVAFVRRDHEVQRVLLVHMSEHARLTADGLVLAQSVDALVLRIFRDMREEERDFLNEELLRDDTVAIDQMCG